jgi:predicted porin
MKKTIIAASIAAVVAAPAAFADVSISGSVQVEYIDSQMETRNDIVFSSSEDLGNGMKASAKMHLVKDDGTDDTDGAAVSNGDFTASLSGDFGTLTAGRQEGFQEAIFDAFLDVDGSHDLHPEGDMDDLAEGFTRDEMIQYRSPNMNGLSFALNFEDAATEAAGGKFENSEMMVTYSANGLKVMAGTGSEGDNDFTNFAASYKMGDLEVRAQTRNADTGAADSTSNGVAAIYTMGANTLTVAMVDSEENGDAAVYGIKHSLSKNTSVYVASRQGDADGDDATAIGMKVAF